MGKVDDGSISKTVGRPAANGDEPVEVRKYQRVLDFLHGEIVAGRYKDGDRLPSESQLVRKFETSRPTIARAMQELRTRGMIERRAGAGSFVTGPKATAAQLLFGLLIPGLGDTEIFESICGQIARECQALGHGLLWADFTSVDTHSFAADRICEPFVRRAVSGVFFAPLELTPEMDVRNRQVVARLESAKIPIVLLDRDFEPFPARSRYDIVGIDNFAAGHMLASHLLSCGCKSFAFFAHPFSAATVQARADGVLAAASAAGMSLHADWLTIGEATEPARVQRMLDLVKPDAIVCANDKTAAELMQTLHQLKVNVPADVQVAGIDDVKYAKLLRPTLTTIHQPCSEIATVAIRTMLDRVSLPTLPPRSTSLPVRLVVRQSTRVNARRSAGA